MPEPIRPPSDWKRTTAALLGLLLIALAFQGSRGLWEPDEGRYSNVAMEMIRLGDWLTPHLHHEQEHWTKPPLTYWAIAASLEAFGRSEWAARLTSALAFFATAVLVGLLGRQFLERSPWSAAFIYAASPLPFVAANLVTTDSLLALWECLTVYAFARATWPAGDARRGGWLMVMWAAAGLAFLTKGPPGLLPLLAIVLYRLTAPAPRPRLGVWPGILVMLAVALPWYLVVIGKNPHLLQYFLANEVVARVASGGFHRNSEWYGAFKVYLPTLLVGFLPWTWWLLRAAWGFAAKLWAGGWRTLGQLDPKQRFLLWWILLPLAIFCLARSRLPLYVLPLGAPLALVAAREIQRRHAQWTRTGVVLTALWIFALLAGRGLSGTLDFRKDARAAANALRAVGITSCNELAFFETKPMMGLNFYLDCEVERIRAAGLAEELAEPEERLWAVRHDRADAFEAKMRQAGRPVERIADLPKLWLVYREIDGGNPPGGH